MAPRLEVQRIAFLKGAFLAGRSLVFTSFACENASRQELYVSVPLVNSCEMVGRGRQL
jgi:hypothetical protein